MFADGDWESSSDSDYEYYHTEIFEQLPSIQAVHASPNAQAEQVAGPGSDPGGAHTTWRPKDKEAEQPLKNMTLCIQAKRDIRWERTPLPPHLPHHVISEKTS